MVRATHVEIDVHLDESGTLSTMAAEVHEGLTSQPKWLSSKYFYDDRGSALFERITELPEYYLTRAEHGLLERHAADIAAATRPEELVELGPGAAKKTRLLIDAMRACGTLRRYVPVEVSPAVAEKSAQRLAEAYPGLAIHALVGDFVRHLSAVPEGGRRLVALLGSTIGNFPEDEAIELLAKTRDLLGGDDRLLLGVDLIKDRAVLEAAYNDSKGVTAEFNRNILHVINRHLDGDFEPQRFDHVAVYSSVRERIESALRSRGEQTVYLREIDLRVRFDDGELLATEISCKYTRASTERLLAAAGLQPDLWFGEEAGVFGLVVARPAPV